MITEEQLKSFCSDNPAREAIVTPWTVGNHTYATDGSVILCVPATGEEYPDELTRPDITKIMALNDEVIAWVEIETESINTENIMVPCQHCRKGKGHATKCEECDGSGEVECWECGNDRSCEACNGQGNVYAGTEICTHCEGVGQRIRYKQAVTAIGIIDLLLVEKFQELGFCEFGVSRSRSAQEYGKPIAVRSDGWSGALCRAARNTKEDYAEYIELRNEAIALGAMV